VAGFGQSAGGPNHAFFSAGSGSGLIDLGTLPGGLSSQANGLNDGGLVTGQSDIVVAGRTTVHAFISSNGGSMADLGTFPGGHLSMGFAINNSGVVAGAADVSGFLHAFTYAGSFVDLHTLGGNSSQANAINQSGVVAGSSDTGAAGISHAFRTDSQGVMRDLNTLPGDSISSALAINNSGQVAGYSGSGNTFHAFRSDRGTNLLNLGSLSGTGSSKAFGINDRGDVVGVSDVAGGGTHAFLYSDKNGLQDLNDLLGPNSGWTLEGALAINDGGQITGYGVMTTSGGASLHASQTEPHAFVLTPTAAAPAPPSLILTAIGSMCLGLCGLKKFIRSTVAS